MQRLVASLALFCFFTLCTAPFLTAQEPEWEKASKIKLDQLVQKNGEGTDQALKAELLKMLDKDQNIRQRSIDITTEKKPDADLEMQKIDQELTGRLKQIVAAKGWPTIHLVGLKASGAAALILIHSPDHAFQRKMLPLLHKLVDEDKIVGSDIALVTDKLLMADGKPQRFGTQFATRDGKMVMSPVEDPAHLEQRRAQYLLPPMAAYKKILADAYHMPVE